MKKKIAIIGAGIGGLTLANLLQKNSEFEFTIYEKKESLNLEEGFGIQLAVNSVSILNQIGFSSLSKSEIYNPIKLDFYSNEDKICDLDLTQFNSKTEKYTTLKRSSLIKLLKDKLFSNMIRFNKTIESVEQDRDILKIKFKDGTSEEVDYLVVSDGVFSYSKSIIEKKSFKLNYYGAVVVRTEIKAKNVPELKTENISLFMGSKAHLVSYPVNDSGDINVVCILRKKLNEKKSIEQLLSEKFDNKNKYLLSFFKENLKSWSIYTSLKPTKSILKKVFYIGDAFYTFPPTLAQGASQSIESAKELYDLLIDDKQNVENIYFEKRLKKIIMINNRSRFNYFMFHFSNPFLKIFRNQFLKRLIKSKSFINRYLGKIYN
ncbi:FAD-dependent monooxygenase [Pelagibacteraceae bacterium]|nr:FAD-dependent monooxygenase [Pelagibacteraceae bacterium]